MAEAKARPHAGLGGTRADGPARVDAKPLPQERLSPDGQWDRGRGRRWRLVRHTDGDGAIVQRPRVDHEPARGMQMLSPRTRGPSRGNSIVSWSI